MSGMGDILSSLSSVNWRGLFYFARWIFITLDIILVVTFVFVFFASLKFRPHFITNPRKAKTMRRIQKNPHMAARWNGIIIKAPSGPPQSWVLAIIEADKFVDDILKQLGVGGEHMADRLEKLTRWDISSLDALWRAHRIRNELVHTSDYSISSRDAQAVLDTYGKFLKELGVI